MTPDNFAHFAEDNPPAAEKKVFTFLSQDRLKVERGEITTGTVNNWLKTVSAGKSISVIVNVMRVVKVEMTAVAALPPSNQPTMSQELGMCGLRDF